MLSDQYIFVVIMQEKLNKRNLEDTKVVIRSRNSKRNLEDTKVVIRRRNSKTDKQYNGQMK